MAGAVIENVSSKKIYLGFGIFALILVAGFIVGGIFASNPSSAEPSMPTMCLDKDASDFTKWLMPWHPSNAPPTPEIGCQKVKPDAEATGDDIPMSSIYYYNVTYALHIPRNGDELSPWKNFLKVLIYPTLSSRVPIGSSHAHSSLIEPKDTEIFFKAKIGYRDDVSEKWKLLSQADLFRRPYNCQNDSYQGWECDPMDFIELGSVPHKYYLINFKLPKQSADSDKNSMNERLGVIEDMHMPIISQPARFTKIWLSLQTCTFSLQIVSIFWFCQRLFALNRPKTLIEKSILTLAIGIQMANFPLQLIALTTDAPWMLLVSDIRTGLVNFLLFSFWLIFISEHLLHRVDRDKFSNYRIQMCLIVICTLSMFLYDCVERGIQITDPFWSIHDSPRGASIAKIMPIIGLISGFIYCVYLVYLVAKVSLNLIRRQNQFVGRLSREGLVVRFQTVLGLTLVSAIFSLVVFNYSSFTDEPIVIRSYTVQVNAAMQTGLYVLWNLYVVALLILYAPSHKQSSEENIPFISSSSTSIGDSRNDEIPTLSHLTAADQLASLTAEKIRTD